MIRLINILLFVLLSYISSAQESFSKSDSLIQLEFREGEFPFVLAFTPQIKLPSNLRVDNIQGRAFVSVWIDTIGNIKWHSLRYLSIKDSLTDFTLKFRLPYVAITDSVDLNYYPLPIQPYVIFLKAKILELKLKENIFVKKQIFYYNIPFELE